ncbi:MAG: hypothetical protein CMH27_05180 [Micavibrio sp.]|nr:hypothetical protein [Micavibrio sp.]|tara:strand:- start:17885 stop:18895 length:1011 start_codon:yes stop_codon:yes gene_type:complete
MHKTFYDSAVYFYVCLLIGSCFAAFYPDASDSMMAFVGVLWSLLVFGMLLWMLERLHYHNKFTYKLGKKRLPEHLLDKMKRQKVYSKGMRSLKSFSVVNWFLLVSLLIFFIWGLWVTHSPNMPESLYALNDRILYYFKSFENFDRDSYRFFSFMDVSVRNILPLFIVALAYWAGQVFAYSNRNGHIIMWLCISLFVISLLLFVLYYTPVYNTFNLGVWGGYGWGRIDVLKALGVISSASQSSLQVRLYTLGLPGVFFLYLPALVVALIFIRNMFTKSTDRYKITLGLVILCVLFCIDAFYADDTAAFALWLSGWSCIAFLSIRGRTDVRKIYRIYQ